MWSGLLIAVKALRCSEALLGKDDSINVPAGSGPAFARSLDQLQQSEIPVPAWLADCRLPASILISGGGPTSATRRFGSTTATLLIGENLVQQALIGGAARLLFLLVLMGIIGGMQSFGLLGLLLGPVIMAARLTIWREWIGGED